MSKIASTRTGCVIPLGEMYRGKQGLDYVPAVSAENAGSTGLWFGTLTIPPGGRTTAHLHESHETAIYVISGRAAMWYGDRLELHLEVGAGEYLYIPAGVPHLPYNPGPDEAVAVLSRTDPNEQESVVLRPELEHLVP